MLKDDGTVWAWGDNYSGQFGDGTTTSSTTPIQASGLLAVTAIAAESDHTVALKNDGTVWTWGSNWNGQLGDGTTTNSPHPIQVPGLSGVVAIAVGRTHTVAQKVDGTVWAWGDNSYGQIGDGTTTLCLSPAPVSGMSGFAAIAVGFYHTVALQDDGTVWAWGENDYGQIGDDTIGRRTTPVKVSGISEVAAVAANFGHSVALKDDGTVWGWGSNASGQLGDGSTTSRTTPVKASGLSEIVAITAGLSHTVALKADGTVWAWGDNSFGQLGDGTTTFRRTTPVQVSSLSEVSAIAAGHGHTVALKNDGTVWAWGWNNFGQLGDGTTTRRTSPVQISGLSAVTAIAVESDHTVALKDDGTVWAWGSGDYGQLGDGTTTFRRTTPGQVSDLSGAVAIAAGYTHIVALKDDGTVWAWGDNWNGTLGDGTTITRTLPVQVLEQSEIAEIAAGGHYTMMLKDDGTVWGWGENKYGQLGIDPGWSPKQALINLFVYTVTPSVGVNGSLSPNTPQWVNHGEVVNFTVTIDPGYQINLVSNCGGSLVGNTYTTDPLTADCTVTATFSQIFTHTLSVTLTGQGTVYSTPGTDMQCTDNCAQGYVEGTVVTLNATPALNYDFTGWSGECTGTGDCIVTIDAAKNVKATFYVNNIPFPAMIEGKGTFTNIQVAYDSIPLGQSDTMKVKAGDQGIVGLLFDRDVSVVFEGGYDDLFENSISSTTMSGSLTISDGQANISDLIIK